MKQSDIYSLTGETYAFRRLRLKSFRTALIAINIVSVVAILVFMKFPDSTRIIFCALAAVSFVVLGYGYTTRIMVGPDGVTCRTLFQTYTFAWSEIRSTGAFLNKKNGAEHLKPNEYDKPYPLREIFFWLSKHADDTERKPVAIAEDYLSFHYDPKAAELIRGYLDRQRPKGKSADYTAGNMGFSQ